MRPEIAAFIIIGLSIMSTVIIAIVILCKGER